jgi:hypothetical protein
MTKESLALPREALEVDQKFGSREHSRSAYSAQVGPSSVILANDQRALGKIKSEGMTASSAVLRQSLDRNGLDVVEQIANRVASYADCAASCASRIDAKAACAMLDLEATTLREAIRIAETIGHDAEADQ